MKTTSIHLLLSVSVSLLTISCSPKSATPNSMDSVATPAPEAKASPRTAENKIEGAFGKKFGEVFDPSSATDKDALEDGTPMYRFTPDKPLGSIEKYYVLITPTTHKVYSIWAEGKVGNEQASKDQDTIMQMIEQKYGAQPKEQDSLGDLDDDTRFYHQGTRSIMTRIHRYTQPIIEIRYSDSTLSDLADAEKAETAKQKAKTLDNSSL